MWTNTVDRHRQTDRQTDRQRVVSCCFLGTLRVSRLSLFRLLCGAYANVCACLEEGGGGGVGIWNLRCLEGSFFGPPALDTCACAFSQHGCG